uniref:Sulfotransfer_1 domain-containing protein n=1 Tax=Parastrongyloides trichosuri TaxID=131310 RepID=A0A0N4ZM50_PARTI
MKLYLFYLIFLTYLLIQVCTLEDNVNKKEVILYQLPPLDFCNNILFEHQCIRMQYKSFPSDYTVAPMYKINACYIGKSFSTITIGLFCYLYDKKTFFKKYDPSSDQVNYRELCSQRNIHHTIPEMIKRYENGNESKFINEWKHLMIVREPVKRFISGFVQLCVLKIGVPLFNPYCYGCERNMRCFLENLYLDIESVRNNWKEPNLFIKYHFYPQSWQCDYSIFKEKYNIIHYNNNKTAFYKEYLKQLDNSSIPKRDLLYVHKLMRTSKVKHSTYDKKESKYYLEELVRDSYLLKLLCKIYYDDFIEFKFDFPCTY